MTILTITLNASVDTTYVLAAFVRGATNRVQRKEIAPGGKGNNVARVLATLGRPVVTTGFLAGRAGRYIDEALRAEGIATDFTVVPGESRTSLALIERETGTVSELLEPGMRVSAEDGRRFLAALPARLRGVEAVAISGSLPPGLPVDYYATLIRALRRFPVRVAFDSSGEPFRLGVAAQPDLIKPNATEFADLIGRTGTAPELADLARRELIGSVLAPDAAILLSLGAEGAALITAKAALFAPAPPVSVVSTVGCGDALLAGFLDARARGDDDLAALRWAVAVGSAAALHDRPGVVDPADVARLSNAVEVRG